MNGFTRPSRYIRWCLACRRSWALSVMLLPAFLTILVFHYFPLYGIQMAFQDFRPALGFSGSEWVGFENFARLFRSSQFPTLLKNTLYLSLYGLAAGFPAPLILALMLNQLRTKKLKRLVQTATYLPHFISMVVLAGMVLTFLSPSMGLYGLIARKLGVEKPLNLLADKNNFLSIYVLSGIWQNMGWDSIIYMAALSGINPEIYESATIDGIDSFKRMICIDLPLIVPTIVILLIFSAGGIMNVGYEKALLLQNDMNLSRSELISTYVYKLGIQNAQYSFSAAVGLLNSVINGLQLVLVNRIAQATSEYSLW